MTPIYTATSVQPTEGQFVAIWEHKGKLWGETRKIDKDGYIFCYNSETNKWEADTTINHNELKPIYFILANEGEFDE